MDCMNNCEKTSHVHNYGRNPIKRQNATIKLYKYPNKANLQYNSLININFTLYPLSPKELETPIGTT